MAWQTIDTLPLEPSATNQTHCVDFEPRGFFFCITFFSLAFGFCLFVQRSQNPATTFLGTSIPCEVPLSPSCSVNEALISRGAPRDGSRWIIVAPLVVFDGSSTSRQATIRSACEASDRHKIAETALAGYCTGDDGTTTNFR